MESNPVVYLRNINLVRDVILEKESPFKIAWDLQTRKPHFYLSEQEAQELKIEKDMELTNET